MMLNLNSIMVSSEKPEVLSKFYGEVLQSKPAYEDPASQFVGYKAGDGFISFGPHDQVHGKSANPERIIIFFETKEVEAEFNRIKAIDGASVIKEPYNPGEEGDTRLATLADPDGNYFQLATPWE